MANGDIIPDGEILFKYISPTAFPEGQEEIPEGIFNDIELSCDWKKYRTNPKTSFHLSEGKTIIIEIQVHDEIRNIRNPSRTGQIVDAWKQTIMHDPVTQEQDPIHGANEAHSLIMGRKKGAVRAVLKKHSRIF